MPIDTTGLKPIDRIPQVGDSIYYVSYDEDKVIEFKVVKDAPWIALYKNLISIMRPHGVMVDTIIAYFEQEDRYNSRLFFKQ